MDYMRLYMTDKDIYLLNSKRATTTTVITYKINFPLNYYSRTSHSENQTGNC